MGLPVQTSAPGWKRQHGCISFWTGQQEGDLPRKAPGTWAWPQGQVWTRPFASAVKYLYKTCLTSPKAKALPGVLGQQKLNMERRVHPAGQPVQRACRRPLSGYALSEQCRRHDQCCLCGLLEQADWAYGQRLEAVREGAGTMRPDRQPALSDEALEEICRALLPHSGANLFPGPCRLHDLLSAGCVGRAFIIDGGVNCSILALAHGWRMTIVLAHWATNTCWRIREGARAWRLTPGC